MITNKERFVWILIFALLTAGFSLRLYNQKEYMRQFIKENAELKQKLVAQAGVLVDETNFLGASNMKPAISCPAGLNFQRAIQQPGGDAPYPYIVEYCAIGENDGKQLRNGEFVQRAASGELRARGTYNDNLKEGTYTTYYAAGKKRQEITFHKDLKDGPFIEYSPDGAITNKGFFKQGKEYAGVENAKIELKLISSQICKPQIACYTYQITNLSNALIESWEINLQGFDSSGAAIASGVATGLNLPTRVPATISLEIPNVDPAQIAKYSVEATKLDILFHGQHFSVPYEFSVVIK